jgi:hypothetical protein
VLPDCSPRNRITPDTDLSRWQAPFVGVRAFVSALDSKREVGDYLFDMRDNKFRAATPVGTRAGKLLPREYASWPEISRWPRFVLVAVARARQATSPAPKKRRKPWDGTWAVIHSSSGTGSYAPASITNSWTNDLFASRDFNRTRLAIHGRQIDL